MTVIDDKLLRGSEREITSVPRYKASFIVRKKSIEVFIKETGMPFLEQLMHIPYTYQEASDKLILGVPSNIRKKYKNKFPYLMIREELNKWAIDFQAHWKKKGQRVRVSVSKTTARKSSVHSIHDVFESSYAVNSHAVTSNIELNTFKRLAALVQINWIAARRIENFQIPVTSISSLPLQSSIYRKKIVPGYCTCLGECIPMPKIEFVILESC